MKVRKLSSAAAAAAALIIGTTAVPASAQAPATAQQKVDDGTFKELVAHLAEDGVPTTQQKALERHGWRNYLSVPERAPLNASAFTD